MAEPLDEPLGVVPRDELADDSARLGEILKAVETGRSHQNLAQPDGDALTLTPLAPSQKTAEKN